MRALLIRSSEYHEITSRNQDNGVDCYLLLSSEALLIEHNYPLESLSKSNQQDTNSGYEMSYTIVHRLDNQSFYQSLYALLTNREIGLC